MINLFVFVLVISVVSLVLIVLGVLIVEYVSDWLIMVFFVGDYNVFMLLIGGGSGFGVLWCRLMNCCCSEENICCVLVLLLVVNMLMVIMVWGLVSCVDGLNCVWYLCSVGISICGVKCEVKVKGRLSIVVSCVLNVFDFRI